MFFQLISFSLSISSHNFQLLSFASYYNFSHSFSSVPNKRYDPNPFLLLYQKQCKRLMLSNFAYFSNSIDYTLSKHSLYKDLRNNKFHHRPSKPIILQSEDFQHPVDYISLDFKSPLITSSSVFLRHCKFNALSSTQGTPDKTTGGAFYSNGFQSSFLNCTFMGNAATKAVFNQCRFFQNKANIDIGAILFEQCEVSISDSYYVENTAILSIGAIFAKDSSLNFDVVVFHMNHANYQTGALEISNSKANINVNQFSNNSCTKESGGISIIAANVSYLSLVGCNFETIVKDNADKHPIVIDHSSYFTAKMNCFDATEDEIRSKVSGSFTNSFNKFGHKCPCNHISFDVPFDVTEIDVKVQDKLLNIDFFGNVIAIFIVLQCVVFFMLKKNKNEANVFQRL